MTFTIRQATLADRDAILEFIDATYEELAPYKGAERWDWQLVENPFRIERGDRVAMWLAIDDASGRIAGQMAVQHGQLLTGGAEYPAGWIVDLMILPEFRGHGLGHKIHAAAAADVTTLMAVTMADATRRIVDRHGCITLGPAYQLNRLLRVRPREVRHYIQHRVRSKPSVRWAFAALFAIKGEYPLAVMLNAFTSARDMFRKSPRSRSIVIELINAMNEQDAVFIGRVEASRTHMFKRSAEFFEWRFRQAPDLNYQIWRATREGATVGLIVLRECVEGEFSCGVIADLLAVDGDTDAIDAMLDFTINRFRGRVQAISAGASSHDMLDAYRRAGFVRTRTLQPTIVCADPALSRALEANKDRWFFTKADHDWDQVRIAAG